MQTSETGDFTLNKVNLTFDVSFGSVQKSALSQSNVERRQAFNVDLIDLLRHRHSAQFD